MTAALPGAWAQSGGYDGGSRAVRPYMDYPASAPYTRTHWQGFYAGLHGGYGFGGIDAHAPFWATATNQGGVAGMHGGYNWQSGSVVYGLETDLSLSWASGNTISGSGAAMSSGIGWLGSLRGRIGYDLGPAMLYATAGVGLSRSEIEIAQGAWSARADDVLLGLAFGGGLEMKLMPEVSARIEALHYRFSDKTVSTLSGLAPYDADQTVVRAGLTFHLK